MDSASSVNGGTARWIPRRASGVLLHPTSLHGAWGVGDLGPAAHAFAAFLDAAGQSWWQMLPVGLVGPGDSPYQSPSSFAGNPLLISPEGLDRKAHAPPSPLPDSRVDYDAAKRAKDAFLRRTFDDLDAETRAEFESWWSKPSDWLVDYVLFAAIRESLASEPWWSWPEPLRDRDPSALREVRDGRLATLVRFHAWVQWVFEEQWRSLAAACAHRGIQLLGDLPIYVAHDSAEVWAHRELFDLLSGGLPRAVAGVPPDYFSQDGQLWGNPLYRWEEHERTGFAWWIERLRVTLARFRAVRLDHFIGFVNYWEVPAGAKTARGGRWVPGPGKSFFDHVRRALGDLPFLAEDLGEVTPPIEKLRDQLGLPGIRILQFSFGDEQSGPEHYPQHSVAYSGTHDNNTLVGWLRDPPARDDPATVATWKRERDAALARVGGDGPQAHEKLLDLLAASPSRLVVTPLQDVLGLGSNARMNRPGTARGNWGWRCHASDLTPSVAARWLERTRAGGRALASREVPR